jgi:pilus assembly protein CpaB
MAAGGVVTRRRRALLLIGLALLLGGLAASDVARREAALHRELGPAVPVVVARAQLPKGVRLTQARLALRRLPARFVPPGAFSSPAELTGLRTAIAIPAGGFLSATALDDGSAEPSGPPIRAGERIAEVVAAGRPDLVVPGARVDVLVSRDQGDGSPGRTVLALEDVEVLAAAPAEAVTGEGGSQDGGGAGGGGVQRVAASLRVTLRQAVYLAAAQSFARELRLLPRAAGERARGDEGLAVDQSLS